MKTKIQIPANLVRVGQTFWLNDFQDYSVTRLDINPEWIDARFIYYNLTNNRIKVERCPNDYLCWVEMVNLSEFRWNFIRHLVHKFGIDDYKINPFILDKITSIECENHGSINRPSWCVVINEEINSDYGDELIIRCLCNNMKNKLILMG